MPYGIDSTDGEGRMADRISTSRLAARLRAAGVDLRPLVVVLTIAGFAFAWPFGVAMAVFALYGERLGWRVRADAFFEGLSNGLGKGGACCCGPAAWYYDTRHDASCAAPNSDRGADRAADRAGRPEGGVDAPAA